MIGIHVVLLVKSSNIIGYNVILNDILKDICGYNLLTNLLLFVYHVWKTRTLKYLANYFSECKTFFIPLGQILL